jgi:hypothetical protein
MERVIMFRTSDGVLHEDYLRAERHAEEKYGNKLTSLAHRLVAIEKYTTMLTALETLLPEFVTLDKLKQDGILSPDEQED